MIDIRAEICKAVDTILGQRLNEQKNDYTIDAEIVECLDESLGAYLVHYQKSYFTAYSADNTFVYSPGMMVSITISSGDFSDIKKINPSTDQNATNFLPIIDIYGMMNRTSANCFDTKETRTLTQDVSSLILYQDSIDGNDDNNTDNNINYSLQNTDYFIIESSIKTKNLEDFEGLLNYGFRAKMYIFKDLKLTDIINEDYPIIFKYKEDENSQYDTKRGKYKVVLEGKDGVSVLDSEDHLLKQEDGTYVTEYYEVVEKEFLFTVDDMQNNPYRFMEGTFVNKIFSVEVDRIYKLNSLEIFLDKTQFMNDDNDIEYSITFEDINFYTAEKYQQDDVSTYIFRIKSNNYLYYTMDPDIDDQDETIYLEAELLTRGRKVDFEKQDAIFYWFEQDASVQTSDSDGYSPYGGIGWRCLNNKINYDNGKYSYANGKYKLYLKKSDLHVKDKYKCVIHYGGDERKIITKNYWKLENTYFKNDRNWDEYCIKAYSSAEAYERLENNRRNAFYTAGYNLELVNYPLPPEDTKEKSYYKYYWTKSDDTGLSVALENDNFNSPSIRISSSDIVNYAYFSCTIYYKNKKVSTNYIKISNALNIITTTSLSETSVDQETIDRIKTQIVGLREDVDADSNNSIYNIKVNNINCSKQGNDINIFNVMSDDAIDRLFTSLDI